MNFLNLVLASCKSAQNIVRGIKQGQDLNHLLFFFFFCGVVVQLHKWIHGKKMRENLVLSKTSTSYCLVGADA